MSRRFVIVCGGKGGCGSTTIALELAQRLGSSGGAKVLVDADLCGRRSHAVSFDVVKQMDASRMPGAPATAFANGLRLLELTGSFEDGFSVRQDAVEAAIAELPADAVVVVDAPQPFAAVVRPFVTRAFRFVLLTEPTLLGVSGANQMLDAMLRFGIPMDRITVVVNARSATRQFKLTEIAKILGVEAPIEVPQAGERRFTAALASLGEALDRAPELIPLPDLRHSASKPIGDRRAGNREATLAVVPARAVNGHAPGTSVPTDEADLDPEHVKREQIKAEIQAAILSKIDFAVAARFDTSAAKMAELRAQVNAIAGQLLSERRDVGSVEDAARLKQELIEESLGLGPIEPFLQDPDVTEIMVNGYREVYVERGGRIELTPKRFANNRQVRLVIERILSPLGRRCDESSPMVDARLPDGSRVNAIIEPLSIDGPMLTIRRFGTQRLKADDLVRLDSVTPAVVDLLRACVEARLNILVSGGTGSGKTTLLNLASSFIPRHERIITIEDAAELLLDQPHVIRLESRPPNLEERGEVRIRDLVRNALRMRPDRIIVGECRAGETLDMLQAMNTGHDGSLTTVHANSARDALARVETMVLMAGFDLPIRAIREQMSSAIDVVVQLARLSDGTRKLTSVCEVIGMEGDVVTMQEIARHRQRGLDADGRVLGDFEFTGVQPHFLKRFVEMGVTYDSTELSGTQVQAAARWSVR